MANAIVPAAMPALSIGGRVFTDLANLKILRTAITNVGGATNGSGRLNTGSAGYQVTAGKTLKVKAVRCFGQTFTAAGIFYICYSDNDVGLVSTTAFTNATYSGNNTSLAVSLSVNAGGIWYETAYDFDIPAQKYPGAQLATGTYQAMVEFYGYEE